MITFLLTICIYELIALCICAYKAIVTDYIIPCKKDIISAHIFPIEILFWFVTKIHNRIHR